MFYWLLWPVRALLTPFWVMFALLAGLAAIVGLVIVLNGHLYEEWKLHRERLAAFTGDPGRADEGDIVRLTPPPLHESVNGQAVASDFRLDAVTLTDDTGAPLAPRHSRRWTSTRPTNGSNSSPRSGSFPVWAEPPPASRPTPQFGSASATRRIGPSTTPGRRRHRCGRSRLRAK